jgi:hypothetical protein
MSRTDVTRYLAPVAVVLLAATMAACGGSPASPSSPTPTTAPASTPTPTPDPTPTPTPSPSPDPYPPPTPDPAAPTFTDVSSQILTPICTPCHTANGRSPAGGLNLTSSVAWVNLVNAASSGKSGATRVVPGDPDGSYLIQKLLGAPGIVGARMPFGGPYLSNAQITLIRNWIAAGALDD